MYTPKTLEELIGIDPATLRLWRQRNFLLPFGKQEKNGHWTYTAADLIGIFATQEIRKVVPDPHNAARMANWLAPEVARHLDVQHPSTFPILGATDPRMIYPDEGELNLSKRYRYALFAGVQSNPIITDDPSKLADLQGPIGDLGTPVFIVISLKALANKAPPTLTERLLLDDKHLGEHRA